VIFDDPESRAARVHGPAGYASHESYRPWLRDEFTFCCVYCLKRETWGQVTGEFELDHFQPQSLAPDLRLDYFNLVYACRRCNAVNRSIQWRSPFQAFTLEVMQSPTRLTSPLVDTCDKSQCSRHSPSDAAQKRLRFWACTHHSESDVAAFVTRNVGNSSVRFRHDVQTSTRA
jgi:hypothetical protein